MREYPPDSRLLPGATAPTSIGHPHGDDSVSLRQIIGVIRRHYRLVLAVTVVGAALGAYVGASQHAQYEANGVMRLALERRSLTGDIERPAELGRNSDPMISAVELIRSRSVLAAVVDSLGLQLRIDPDGAFSRRLLSQVKVDTTLAGSDSITVTFTARNVTARLGSQKVSAPYGEPLRLGTTQFAIISPPPVTNVVLRTVPQEVAVDALRKTVRAWNRKDTDVMDIAYLSSDPWFAQQVVNSVIRSYQSINLHSAVAKSHRRRKFLEEQLAESDSLLMRAQSELATFRSRQQLASSQSALEATQNALVTLDARKTELESDRKTFRTLQGQLRSGKEASRAEALRALASSPALGDNPSVANLYQQLTVHQYRLDSMMTGPWAAAPTNPDVIHLKSLIASTQAQLTRAVSSHLSSIDARIGSIGSLRGRSGASIQALPAMAEEEYRLNRRVETLSRIGDQTRQDYQKARMAEEVEAGDIDVVDYAALPYIPVWQTAKLMVGLGLLLGLLFGSGVAFLIEHLNTSIRRPEDIESLLHVPGLAVIPRLTAAPDGPHTRLAGLLGRGKQKRVVAPDGGRRAAMLGMAAQPFSIGIEAFRMLRTSLVWAEGGEQLRTLVVTSAAPGEGKTMTSANLAVTYANDGLSVLLVDCDIRRPKLHGVFKTPRSPGLLELLSPANSGAYAGVRGGPLDGHASNSDTDDMLTPVLRPTPIRGLTLLTCGAMPTNPTNLLSGVRMRALLQELVQRFDLVILDTPPVLATADARILGGISDGVLLVVRAGQTDRVAAQRAQHQLLQAGARLLGVVLNDPGGEVSGEGDYYYPYAYVAEPE
jgi:succinoglycan biosynthesis transport protein ExoP